MIDDEKDYSFYVMAKKIPVTYLEMDYSEFWGDEFDLGEAPPADEMECYLTWYDDSTSFGNYNGYWRKIMDHDNCWTLRGNTIEELLAEIEKERVSLKELDDVYIKKITVNW